MIILPRQARDKGRGNSKGDAFSYSVWAECVHAEGFVASTNFQSQLGKNGSSSTSSSSTTATSSVAVEVNLGGTNASSSSLLASNQAGGNLIVCLEVFDGKTPLPCGAAAPLLSSKTACCVPPTHAHRSETHIFCDAFLC